MSDPRTAATDPEYGKRSRACYGWLFFDDGRESRREVPACYGYSRRTEEAMAEDRRVMLTGDVVGRYRYTCLGASRRSIPFYREGRRVPTMEERKRGTEFPMCAGLEIMFAEKVAEGALERRESGESSRATDAGEGAAIDEDGRRIAGEGFVAHRERHMDGEYGEPTTAMGEAAKRLRKSSGKIASNMYRHASFIFDSACSVFKPGR